MKSLLTLNILICTLLLSNAFIRQNANYGDIIIQDDEFWRMDIHHFFEGYNLSFAIEDESNNLNLQQKLSQVANATNPITSMIDVQVPTDDTEIWDSESPQIVLDDNLTIYWALFHKDSVPSFSTDNSYQFETSTTITCYDAQITNSTFAAVDCFDSSSNKTSFYAVDINNKKATSYTFDVTDSRAIGIEHNIIYFDDLSLIVRYAPQGYKALGDDCYFEVFNVDDLSNITSFTFNASDLGFQSLRIVEVDSFNNDLFVADENGYAVRITGILSKDTLVSSTTFVGSAHQNIRVGSDWISGSSALLVQASSLQGFEVLDWQYFEAPRLISSYAYPLDLNISSVAQLESSVQFMQALVELTTTSDEDSSYALVIYLRSQNGPNSAYYILDGLDEPFLSVDRVTNNLFIYDNGLVQNLLIGESYLTLQDGTKSTQANLTISSIDNGVTESLKYELNITVRGADDAKKLAWRFANNNTYTLSYSAYSFLASLEDYVVGDIAHINPTANSTLTQWILQGSTWPDFTFRKLFNYAFGYENVFVGQANGSLWVNYYDIHSMIESSDFITFFPLEQNKTILEGVVTRDAMCLSFEGDKTYCYDTDGNQTFVTKDECTQIQSLQNSSLLFCLKSGSIDVYDASGNVKETITVDQSVNKIQTQELFYSGLLFYSQEGSITIQNMITLDISGSSSKLATVTTKLTGKISFIVGKESLTVYNASNFVELFDLSDVNNAISLKVINTKYNLDVDSNLMLASPQFNTVFIVNADSTEAKGMYTMIRTNKWGTANDYGSVETLYMNGTSDSVSILPFDTASDFIYISRQDSQFVGIRAFNGWQFICHPVIDNYTDLYENRNFSLFFNGTQGDTLQLFVEYDVINTQQTINSTYSPTKAFKLITKGYKAIEGSSVNVPINERDIFNGTVESMDIKQSGDLGSNVKLIPKMEQSSSQNMSNSLKNYNAVAIGSKYTYYQTANRLYMVVNSTVTYKIIDISVPDIIFKYTNCTQLLLDQSEMFSISSCTDTSDGKVYLVVFSYLSSSPFFAQSLETNIGNVAKLYIEGHFLFVVDSSNPSIHTYKITLGQGGNNTDVLVPATIIDTIALQATELDIVSADSHDNGEFIRTFVLDGKGLLYTVDMNSTSLEFANQTVTDFESVHKTAFDYQFPRQNTIWLSITVHKCSFSDYCYIFIAAQNLKSYYTAWHMGYGYSILQPMTSFFNPFRYRLFGQVQNSGNSFVIPAYDIRYHLYALVSYNVEADPSNYRNATVIFARAQLDSQAPSSILELGSKLVPFTISTTGIDLSADPNVTSKVILYVNGTVNNYNMRSNYVLRVSGSNSNGDMLIRASNQHQNMTVEVQVNDGDDESSGWGWFIVLFIALGLIIIAIIYTMRNCKDGENKRVDLNEPLDPKGQNKESIGGEPIHDTENA